MTTAVESKTCANPACRAEFHRPPNKGRAEFAKRQFCCRSCAMVIKHQKAKSQGPRRDAEPIGTSVTPPGVLWRPPGWAPTPLGLKWRCPS